MKKYSVANIINTPKGSINCMFVISITLLIIVLCLLLMIKHPHTIAGRVLLISNSRPYEMLAPQSGKLILLKNQKDSVFKGSDIAYIYRNSDYYSLEKINSVLRTRSLECVYKCLSDTAITNSIGEVSGLCIELRSLLYEWFNFEFINQVQGRLDKMYAKDSMYRKQYEIESHMLSIENAIDQQLTILCKEDSCLYLSRNLSKIQFEQSVRNMLQQNYKLESVKSSILLLKQDMNNNSQELKGFLEEMNVKKCLLFQNIESKMSELHSYIDVWRSQSVIVAAQDGFIELFPNISDGQMVLSGTQIIRDISFEEDVLRGEMLFDYKETGSLKGNESVKITLESYPPTQYGYLLGKVTGYSSSVYSDQTSISSIRKANVSIDMYEQPYWWGNLKYVHGMSGKSEIIVEDCSLLEQIFNFIKINMN